MKLNEITVESTVFLLGMASLGFGLYQWSGLGFLLIVAVLILVTAPDDE